MTTYEEKRQRELRASLDGYFNRAWEDSPMALPKEVAYARFKLFEDAIYKDPQTAVRVAREGVADLDIKDDGEILFSQIRLLVGDKNPARACKLYAGAMTMWTKESATRAKKGFAILGTFATLVGGGLVVAVLGALYKVLFLL